MAKCSFCEQPLHVASDCVWARANPEVHFPSSSVFRYEPYAGLDAPCPGCGAAQGNFHHPDCADLPCPQCRALPAACRCWDERHELKAVETAKEMLRAFGIAGRPEKRRSRGKRWRP